MQYIQSIKPHKGGFAQSQPNIYSTASHAEIMKQLCEEIQLLVKDSRDFEEQYQDILNYYQRLTRKIKKANFRSQS